jgi:formylglycine-generating enzyme required for sulfatase activity
VFDLSGNVWELEDACDGAGESSFCRLRGGSFAADYGYLACGFVSDLHTVGRNYSNADIGFRCCSL